MQEHRKTGVSICLKISSSFHDDSLIELIGYLDRCFSCGKRIFCPVFFRKSLMSSTFLSVNSYGMTICCLVVMSS